MNKNDIIMVFETDLTDPGSLKSGEYLESHILTHAQEIVRANRPALIEILTEWLALRIEPQTMLAVKVAGTVRLHELRGALLALREDIVTGRTFLPFYAKKIDAALNAMGKDVLS